MNLKNSIFAITLASIPCFVLPKINLAFEQDAEIGKSLKVNSNDNKPRLVVDSSDISHITIGARIITHFSPRNSQGEEIEMEQLASDMGYDHFNWVNYVERDPYGIIDRAGNRMLTPYNDPPSGGYRYDKADNFPFYWDIVNCDRCNQRHHYQNYNNLQQFKLVFEDAPADYRLRSGEAVEFLTSLVGVTEINLQQNEAEWEILHTFRWQLTNPHPNYSQVSLVDTDVDLNQLSPSLINMMLGDGAIAAISTQVSNSN